MTKFVQIRIPQALVPQVKAALAEHEKEMQPAKPIKRREFSAAFWKGVRKDIQRARDLSKQANKLDDALRSIDEKIEAEKIRVEVLLEKKLTKSDRAWAESYVERLGDLQDDVYAHLL